MNPMHVMSLKRRDDASIEFLKWILKFRFTCHLNVLVILLYGAYILFGTFMLIESEQQEQTPEEDLVALRRQHLRNDILYFNLYNGHNGLNGAYKSNNTIRYKRNHDKWSNNGEQLNSSEHYDHNRSIVHNDTADHHLSNIITKLSSSGTTVVRPARQLASSYISRDREFRIRINKGLIEFENEIKLHVNKLKFKQKLTQFNESLYFVIRLLTTSGNNQINLVLIYGTFYTKLFIVLYSAVGIPFTFLFVYYHSRLFVYWLLVMVGRLTCDTTNKKISERLDNDRLNERLIKQHKINGKRKEQSKKKNTKAKNKDRIKLNSKLSSLQRSNSRSNLNYSCYSNLNNSNLKFVLTNRSSIVLPNRCINHFNNSDQFQSLNTLNYTNSNGQSTAAYDHLVGSISYDQLNGIDQGSQGLMSQNGSLVIHNNRLVDNFSTIPRAIRTSNRSNRLSTHSMPASMNFDSFGSNRPSRNSLNNRSMYNTGTSYDSRHQMMNYNSNPHINNQPFITTRQPSAYLTNNNSALSSLNNLESIRSLNDRLAYSASKKATALERKNIPIILFLIILLIILYLLIGSLLIHLTEQLTLFDSFVLLYLSITTNGLADYVPRSGYYFITIVCVSLYLGPILIFMFVGVIHRSLAFKLKNTTIT